jgi:hypothetical protein
MTKYPCSLINFEFATFDDVVDSFIGQKVVVKCDDREVIGRVQSCSLQNTTVKLFGDVAGFVVNDTVGVFGDGYIQLPLSPSILGRHLDFFGQPLDDLQPVISISNPTSPYRQNQSLVQKDSQITGKNDWLINSDSFKIQKGQSKSVESIETLLRLLEISNLVLLVVELDFQSKSLAIIQKLIHQNQLDKVTVFFQSQAQNDIQISSPLVSQAANYLSVQLGFDVLILVSSTNLLDNAKPDDFYFTQKFEQLVSSGPPGSISVINI